MLFDSNVLHVFFDGLEEYLALQLEVDFSDKNVCRSSLANAHGTRVLNKLTRPQRQARVRC